MNDINIGDLFSIQNQKFETKNVGIIFKKTKEMFLIRWYKGSIHEEWFTLAELSEQLINGWSWNHHPRKKR